MSSWNVTEVLTSVRQCADHKIHNSCIYIFSYVPLNFGYSENRLQCRPLCSSVTWNPFKISSWNVIEILTNIRQCADRKNHNSWTYIFNYAPLNFGYVENRIQCHPLWSSVTWKPFKTSSWNVIEILTNIKWCADRKNHNSWIYVFLSYAPLNFGYAENRVPCYPLCSSVTWKPFKISSWNVKEI